MICLWHTHRALMSTYSFFFEKGESNILTSLTYPGHKIQAIGAVQWLTEHVLIWLKCNGSDALSQLLCLLQAVCLCVYEKHTRKKYHTIILNHSCSFLTQLNILTCCKLSWKCVRALQSASPAALTFHHELHNHCSRDWKRVSRLFLYFLCFLWSLRVT